MIVLRKRTRSRRNVVDLEDDFPEQQHDEESSPQQEDGDITVGVLTRSQSRIRATRPPNRDSSNNNAKEGQTPSHNVASRNKMLRRCNIIFVFDVSMPPQTPKDRESRQEHIENVISVLKSACNTLCCAPSVNDYEQAFNIGIVKLDLNSVEITQNLQRLDLLKIHQALNSLKNLVENDAHEGGNKRTENFALALDVCLKMFSGQRQQEQQVAGEEMKVVFVSLSLCSGHQYERLRPTLKTLFQENISVFFVNVRPPSSSLLDLESAADFTSFVNEVSSFTNCEVDSVALDKASLRRSILSSLRKYFESVHIPVVIRVNLPNGSRQASSLTSDPIIISCKVESDVCDAIDLTHSKVCHCHFESIAKVPAHYPHEPYLCPVTRTVIKESNVIPLLRVGTHVVPAVLEGQDNGDAPAEVAELEAVQKVTLDNMSVSLLFAQTHILVPSLELSGFANSATMRISEEDEWERAVVNEQKFSALSSFLGSKGQGLILKTCVDLRTRKSHYLPRYYLLMGDSQGRSLVLQRICTSDEYLGVTKREPVCDVAIQQMIYDYLEEVETTEYNPLDLNTEFNDRIETLLSNNKNNINININKPTLSSSSSSTTTTTRLGGSQANGDDGPYYGDTVAIIASNNNSSSNKAKNNNNNNNNNNNGSSSTGSITPPPPPRVLRSKSSLSVDKTEDRKLSEMILHINAASSNGGGGRGGGGMKKSFSSSSSSSSTSSSEATSPSMLPPQQPSSTMPPGGGQKKRKLYRAALSDLEEVLAKATSQTSSGGGSESSNNKRRSTTSK